MSAHPSAPLRVDVEECVAVLTLAKPPMNVLTVPLTLALKGAVENLAKDPTVRAVVLAGDGGRALCAGSDIHELAESLADAAAFSRKVRVENETFSAVAHFPKPTVAAIEGLALGGGLELACCCDLVVASAGARLGLPEVRLGAFPGSGGTVRVTRRVGIGRAMEMMLLGDLIDAQTALAWGLVNRVAPDGEALGLAKELARRLAAGPAQALLACKIAIRTGVERPEAKAIERTIALSEALAATRDLAEGTAAFLGKRGPRFFDEADAGAFAHTPTEADFTHAG